MKKTVFLLCAISLCLFLSLAFSACDFLPTGTTTTAPTTTAATTTAPPVTTVHTHTVGDGWIWDETHHFYACSGENCGAILSKAAHTMENNTCTVCGYVDTSVGSELATYFTFDNLTVSMLQTMQDPDLGLLTVGEESIQVEGQKWLWTAKDHYYGDRIYESFTVYFDGEDAYARGVVDDELSTQKTLFFLGVDFTLYVNSFTETEDGVFEAEEIVGLGGVSYRDVCITVENDKLSSVSYTLPLEMLDESFEVFCSYSFSAWGETVVDGTGYTEPPLWDSYFAFENVTIHKSGSYVAAGQIVNSELETFWHIDGDAWSCFEDLWAEDGVVTESDYAYFDGSSCYLNGDPVEEYEILFYHHEMSILGDLLGLESRFSAQTEGNRTVYTASTLELYDVEMYKNVTLTVENGQIVSLVYTEPYAFEHEDLPCDGTFTLLFENYGTTEVEAEWAPTRP